MANNLTPEQDLIVRAFYVRVAQDDSLFPTNRATQRRLVGECLRLLNYVVLDGKYVTTENVKPKNYMSQGGNYECEWAADFEKAQRAISRKEKKKLREESVDEAIKNPSPDKANSSEPSESPSIWQALFRKDV